MNDYQFDGENMKALMELAVFTPADTTLRYMLETEWFHNTMDRDTKRDGDQLRRDMVYGLRGSIPGSDEARLYAQALEQLYADDRHARLEASGLKLAQ